MAYTVPQVANNAKFSTPYTPGKMMHSGQSLNNNFASPLYSYEDGITATASGVQATARPLYATINNVTVVGTAADAVQLPPAVAGLTIYVTNSDSTDSMQVFGAGIDTINGVATATGIAQAAGKSAVYFCVLAGDGTTVAGKWLRVLSA